MSSFGAMETHLLCCNTCLLIRGCPQDQGRLHPASVSKDLEDVTFHSGWLKHLLGCVSLFLFLFLSAFCHLCCLYSFVLFFYLISFLFLNFILLENHPAILEVGWYINLIKWINGGGYKIIIVVITIILFTYYNLNWKHNYLNAFT